MAELRKEHWSKELIKRLWPDNSFYKRSVSESNIAADVETVRKPIAGKVPDAVEGQPKKLPMEFTTVEDGQKSYPMIKLIAPPIIIDDESEITTSYNKRSEYQQQQADTIEDLAADLAVNKWAPTLGSNIALTTGAGRPTSLAGVTANRKGGTVDDIIKVTGMFRRMNLGSAPGRKTALVTDEFYSDLLKIDKFVDYDKTGNESKLIQGILGRIMGWEIMTRYSEKHGGIGLRYSNASSPALQDRTSRAATDRPANIFWFERYVCHAEAKADSAINRKPPGFVGATVIESWTRFGADRMRDDQKGVVVLLEDVV